MGLAEITSALEVAGGWGIAALALVAVFYLYRLNNKLRDRLSDWQGEQYDALLEMMQNKIEADLKTEAGYKKLHELLQKQVRQGEWTEKQLNEALTLLRK